MSATLALPPRMPRPAPRTERAVRSFLLALAMHALLFAGLWIGVQWRTQPQPEVSAELWSMPAAVDVVRTAPVEPAPAAPIEPAPPVAAPQPAPPPPPPRAAEPERPDADIVEQQAKAAAKLAEQRRQEALKLQAEKRRAEEAKAEAEKLRAEKRQAEEEKLKAAAARRKAEEDRRNAEAVQAKAAAERASAQRETLRRDEQQRMMSQAGAPGGTAAAGSASAAGDAAYAAQIAALIKQHIEFAVPAGTSSSIFATFQVDLLPTGEILAVKLLKASGLAGYDAAAERGIRRTQQFPRKRDGTVERSMIVKLYPVER